MRTAFLALMLAVAGCSKTSVIEVGANRYRAVTEDAFSAGDAERSVVAAARAHCATRGQAAEVFIATSRPVAAMQHAAVTADFVCTPR